MHGSTRSVLAVLGAFTIATAALAQGDVGWPREIEVPEGKVVIYQPQADVLDGNILKGRGAP